MLRGTWGLRGSKRRLGVAVIAYACLLAQVSALAHRALVQHVTCAEHGESVHLRADTAAAVGSQATLGSFASAGWVARVGTVPVAAADEHDHCSGAAFRNLTHRSYLDPTVGPGPCADGVDFPSAVVAASAVAPYRLAPKTSPPRA
jgi:hypothetical protein